jgi:hypothetical protein
MPNNLTVDARKAYKIVYFNKMTNMVAVTELTFPDT